jgi:hypothetical protein
MREPNSDRPATGCQVPGVCLKARCRHNPLIRWVDTNEDVGATLIRRARAQTAPSPITIRVAPSPSGRPTVESADRGSIEGDGDADGTANELVLGAQLSMMIATSSSDSRNRRMTRRRTSGPVAAGG